MDDLWRARDYFRRRQDDPRESRAPPGLGTRSPQNGSSPHSRPSPTRGASPEGGHHTARHGQRRSRSPGGQSAGGLSGAPSQACSSVLAPEVQALCAQVTALAQIQERQSAERSEHEKRDRRRGVISLKPTMDWPRFGDEDTDLDRSTDDFEEVATLANDGDGLRTMEKLRIIGTCLDGSRRKTFEVLRDEARRRLIIDHTATRCPSGTPPPKPSTGYFWMSSAPSRGPSWSVSSARRVSGTPCRVAP